MSEAKNLLKGALYSPAGIYSTAEAVCRYPTTDTPTFDASQFTSPARYLNPDVEMGYGAGGNGLLSEGDLFVESFMLFFATGGEDSLASVEQAMPKTAREWEVFIAGHEDGTIAGMKEGLGALVGDLKTLWDIFATWTMFLTDSRIPVALLVDLWQDKLLGQDSETLKLIEKRFPGFSEAMRQAAVVWRLAGEELPKLVLAVQGNLLRLLNACGMMLAALLGREARDLIDDFVAGFVELSHDRFKQGTYVGQFTGRLAFELLLLLLPLATVLLYPPVAVPAGGVIVAHVVPKAAASSRQATLAVRCARRIFKLWGKDFNEKYKRILKDGGVEGLPDAPEVNVLEKALHEAYQAVAKKNAPFGKLRNETAQVNAFWDRLLDLLGIPKTDVAFRLDAHHIVDNEFREKLKDKPNFKEAFEALGWTDKDSMPAVALETEFHIREGTSISQAMEWPKEKEWPSLSVLLKRKVGDLDQYKTFEQLLNKIEEVYRYPSKDSDKDLPQALWPHVKTTFVEIRKKLNLSAPEAPR